MKKENFLKNRLHSFKYAFNGFFYLIKTENAIKVHIFNTLLLTILGIFSNLNTLEWILQYTAIGILISFEVINTCIEKLCDFIEPNSNNKIMIIKDMSAAAVLISAFFGLTIVSFIYIPKIIQCLSM